MIVMCFIAAFISLMVAAAELITRIRDLPPHAFLRPPTLFYLFFNVSLSLIALYILMQTDMFDFSAGLDRIQAALAAGLGSTVLMRSKFFKADINGKEAAIGPEFVINAFLEFLQREIDRDRAIERKRLVEEYMRNIDFQAASVYVLATITASLQENRPDEVELLEEITKIAQSDIDEVDKSYSLGYLILDAVGERFLKNMFTREIRGRFSRTADESHASPHAFHGPGTSGVPDDEDHRDGS